MTSSRASTKNSKFIKAKPKQLYHAFIDPKALEIWLIPGNMTGKVHNFDLRVGGGYEMSLFYPSNEKHSSGKTSEKEDRYTARFEELIPYERIVETITFNTADQSFKGEMLMEVIFDPKADGTTVTIVFTNIPSGIRLEDNRTGTRSSLEKLAQYVASTA